MKQLITADLQLADNQRDAYRLLFLKTLHKLACDNKVDEILILGDLTEAKDNHSARLVNWIVDEFAQMAFLGEHLVFLRGNHDGTTPDNPFFQFMSHIEGITWINKPTIYKGDLYLPHTLDYKKDWDKLGLWEVECDLIFAHNIFTGATGSGGHPLKDIPPTIFAKGACVISGDVHAPQSFGPITYVGAPYLCDFGDDYKPRVLLIDEKGIRSLPVTGPQKRLIELRVEGGKLESIKGAAELRGDIIKVRVHLPMSEREHWGKHRDQIHKWGHDNGFVIHAIQPIVEYTPGKKSESAAYAPKTDEELVREYGRRRGLDKATLAAGLTLAEQSK